MVSTSALHFRRCALYNKRPPFQFPQRCHVYRTVGTASLEPWVPGFPMRWNYGCQSDWTCPSSYYPPPQHSTATPLIIHQAHPATASHLAPGITQPRSPSLPIQCQPWPTDKFKHLNSVFMLPWFFSKPMFSHFQLLKASEQSWKL